MNPTTFQSVLQHTQVIHDQHPLDNQLHTLVRQPHVPHPEPSYHLLSHQDTRQPSSYRHESDIPPVGPPQEVTSQGNLYNTLFFFFVGLFLCGAWLSHCSHRVSALSSTTAISIENARILYNSGVGPQAGKQDQILHPSFQGEVNYIYAVIAAKKLTWKHASLITVTIIDLATYFA